MGHQTVIGWPAVGIEKDRLAHAAGGKKLFTGEPP
jgi:hypothetical protein